MRQFLEVLTSGDLDLRPFQLKIGTPLTCVLGDVCTSFDFSTFFLFSSYEPVVTDRRTDRQMDKTRDGLIGRPHNNHQV